ncbi:MAG: ABC transporter ATP-binding protein [Acidobacteriota bacterium]|nr:ABC transporter ATP-binding protein [Acidobacteriota bacterium]
MTTATNEQPNPADGANGDARASRRAAISIEGVSKTYPVPLAGLRRLFRMRTRAPVEALKGVSFDVREGEIFGLIGRNGAGKTTLAKIVATLVQPTAGAVVVRGFDSVRDDARVRAQVGLASAEERSFYWRLNVEQNLVFFARLYGLGAAAARRRIGELLELFELTELRRRRFGELSTGNKQRMSVARALLNSPPVLLLDEPTRSLDPLAAARMREIIGSLARGQRPVTVLLTSHNLAEVEQLCERVAVISRGRIRAIDTPQHLRSTHRQHERVRLTLSDLKAARARDLLAGTVEGLEISEPSDATNVRRTNATDAGQADAGRAVFVTVGFEREVGDDTLDRALRALQQGGARLVECEPERGTLLDVLETFERETEEEGRGERETG